MESYVKIKKKSGTLRGMIHIPEGGSFQPPFPGVILYHGFTGNRMEPNFIFVRFSRLLCNNGIASIRFDFMGSGESDGDFEDMTISTEIEDALDIFDFFREREEIDNESVFLLGLSMGGSIAGYIAALKDRDIRGLILWAPAGEMKGIIKFKMEQKEDQPGSHPIDMDGLKLGQEFITDAENLNILEITSRYSGKSMILHGTDDETVPYSVSQQYKDIFGDRAVFNLIHGADHTFKKLIWQESIFRQSLDFIQKYDGIKWNTKEVL